ncbi:MAG TPA: alanine racemase C-terminal domain-containing protein [Solirubrobacteraceae bacterium]|nr:alanine racemase C-terminal domain-containing protein [Solirubrobacteraceae bacterium]
MTDARPSGIRRTARIDLDAFASNIAGASILDARADAYGHGLALVGPMARDAGVASVVVSDERDAVVARPLFAEVLVGRLPRDIDAIGAAAYGLDPDVAGRPVLTLVGEVVAVKHVGADAGVSYGYSYRTSSATTLALVALGYADGVPRLASNRASVRVGSAIHPLVGRVAMDQFVVDCGDDVPELGSDAVLFGDPATGVPGAHDWATATEREPLDLTVGLGARIFRTAGGTV